MKGWNPLWFIIFICIILSTSCWFYVDKPITLKKSMKRVNTTKNQRKLNFIVKPCDDHADVLKRQSKTQPSANKQLTNKKMLSALKASKLTPTNIKDAECLLSARIYPLLFYNLSRNLEFKIAFKSDCFDPTFLFYFMLPWNNPPTLYAHDHPKFVRLNILGRIFDFKFTDAYQRGVEPFVTLAYKHVEIYPTNFRARINTFDSNSIKLEPASHSKPFTVKDMNRLKIGVNPGSCEIVQNNTIMECVMQFLK